MKTTHDSHALFSSPKGRWAAISNRDQNADGSFFYGVKTTGIFCRPSCSSRQPRRENVDFYETSADAVKAGFRACKRCRPETVDTTHPHAQNVLTACRQIEDAIEPVTLSDLAQGAGLSPFHFQRVFKSIVGLSPKQYQKAFREKKVRFELGNSRTVTEAIYDAGYHSSGRFYSDANNVVGMSPSKRKKGAKGEHIEFAVGECSLGAILVAKSEKGICSIVLGDDANTLVEQFQSDFSGAMIDAGGSDFETLVANVIGLVENPQMGLSLPLDIRGTAFQKKVWQALSAIPPGETANYADIAKRIGNPAAVRAVAQACGANKLAVAIPCHRVIRSDGSISGYKWGVERKQALLSRERAA